MLGSLFSLAHSETYTTDVLELNTKYYTMQYYSLEQFLVASCRVRARICRILENVGSLVWEPGPSCSVRLQLLASPVIPPVSQIGNNHDLCGYMSTLPAGERGITIITDRGRGGGGRGKEGGAIAEVRVGSTSHRVMAYALIDSYLRPESLGCMLGPDQSSQASVVTRDITVQTTNKGMSVEGGRRG